MAKLTLTDPSSLSNENTFLGQVAANNALIEAALENTLSRDGTSPNTMSEELDMNSNRIVNLPAAASNTEPVRYAEFFSAIEDEGLNFPLTAPGLVAVTDSETVTVRTITGTAGEIDVAEGDGGAGDPTLSLPDALTFTGKTVTGGTFDGPALTNVTFDSIDLNDSNDSHQVSIIVSSDITADRTLSLAPGDANRVLTLTGDATLDQDVSTTGNPVFATVTVGNSGLHILDTNATHDLIITPGSNLSADRVLTITTGDAARTLTLSADVTLDQSVATTSTPTFGSATLTNFLDIPEQAAPANPSANVGRVYVKDSSGTTKLYFRDNAGTETDILSPVSGKQTIYIPAAAMRTRVSSGAGVNTYDSGGVDITIGSLDFDQTSTEYAHFSIAFPKSWNEGTVSFQPYWTADAGSAAQTVIFALAGIARSDGDALNSSVGTAQTSSDAFVLAGNLHVGPESAAITITGSPAEGDLINFELSRDTTDTLAADARLLGIKLFYTLNAGTDA
jgi:hypothetical protein